jgi:hypothetical protein
MTSCSGGSALCQTRSLQYPDITPEFGDMQLLPWETFSIAYDKLGASMTAQNGRSDLFITVIFRIKQ